MTDPRSTRSAVEAFIEVPRTARFYTMGRATGALELWFVLHGFGQLAREFIQYFADLADDRRLVIAPEALNRYYSVGSTAVPAAERAVGATWMTREDRQNEIGDYVRYLDLLHERLAAANPAARTVVVGFSQGGATASRWAAFGHASIDRLILWGATVPPDLPLAHNVFRGVRLTLVVGRKDHYVSGVALAAERTRLDAARLSYDVVEFDGGHSIKRGVFHELTGEP